MSAWLGLVGATLLVVVLPLYLQTRLRFRKLDRRTDRLERSLKKALARQERVLKKEVSPQTKASAQAIEGLKRSLHKEQAALREQVRSLHEKTREFLRDDEIQAGYLSALAQLYPRFPVFMGGPALDGYTARALFEAIEIQRPAVVMELGSGSSTVLICALLERLGMTESRHISVDHSEYYLDITRRSMAQHGFRRETEYWHCPLTAGEQGEIPFYAGLAERLGDTKIDLLLVDGPPSTVHERSREPALDVLCPHLSERAIVFLDDAARPQEKAIVQRWSEAHPEFSLETSRRGKGFAKLTRSQDEQSER